MIKNNAPTRFLLHCTLAFALIAAGLGGCGREKPALEKKGRHDMDQQFAKAFQALKTGDDKGAQAMSEAMKQRGWEQPRQLVGVIHDPKQQEDTLQKARFLLLLAGDLALTPLLDSIDPSVPDKMVWDLTNAVQIHRENQARIVKRLESLLVDKRLLPLPENLGDIEEKPKPRRVCDEAYLLLRQLLAFDDEEASMVNSGLFIRSMSEKERDQEIERLQKTKKWIALGEQVEAVMPGPVK
jgi:hypothetical protein